MAEIACFLSLLIRLRLHNTCIQQVSSTGMILSNKEKTGKLCNTKSGRHAHVEDMSRARRSRCAFLGGFGGMPPQEIFYFQHGFLDF